MQLSLSFWLGINLHHNNNIRNIKREKSSSRSSIAWNIKFRGKAIHLSSTIYKKRIQFLFKFTYKCKNLTWGNKAKSIFSRGAGELNARYSTEKCDIFTSVFNYICIKLLKPYGLHHVYDIYDACNLGTHIIQNTR